MKNKNSVIIGSAEWQEMKATAPYDEQAEMEREEAAAREFAPPCYVVHSANIARIEELKAELERLNNGKIQG